MDIKLIVTAIGVLISAVLMYGQYAKIAKTPGMTTLSKATLAFRLVISVFSIGLSIYGVFNIVFDFLMSNNANRSVALSVAMLLAVVVASALEFLLVNSEKAVYESFFYGPKKFLAIFLVVLFAQTLNYETMKANASALFNKIFTKESKMVDNILLDPVKDAINENKESINRLKQEYNQVSIDAETLYKASKSYVKYNRAYLKNLQKSKSKKLHNLSLKGNKWAKREIQKYQNIASMYKERLALLKQKAVERAKELEREKRENIQSKIDALVAKNITLSSKTLDKRDAKIEEIKNRANANSEHFINMALAIVITSVFLSLVHAMTSNSTLIDAKENAIIQRMKDVELQEQLNALEYQLMLSKQNYADKLSELKKKQSPSRPNLDQLLSEIDGKDKGEQTDNKEVISELNLEPKKEEVDFNEKLWSIAKSITDGNNHPSRDELKNAAQKEKLDVSRWTEKYKAYLAEMVANGRIKKDGKRYTIMEKSYAA